MDWNCIYDYHVQMGLLLMIGSTYFLYKNQSRKKYNLPPGPRPLPLIGNILSTGVNNLHLKFTKLRETYGDVFTVYLGRTPTVVLNTAELAQEAYLQKSTDFAGRPSQYSSNIFTDYGKDIAFGQYGPVWKLQRKIAHAAIRKYASGQHLENLVHKAFEYVLKEMMKEKGSFDAMKYNFLLVYNILAGMCFGKTMDPDDEFVLKMKEFVTGSGIVADFVPFMQYEVFDTPAVKELKRTTKYILEYLEKQFDEHLDTYNPDDRTDFTYEVIHFWKKAQNEEEDKTVLSKLTKAHFVQILNDMFFAGTDTSRCTLTYFLGYLVNNPDVQDKIHKEIDSIVGPDGYIGLNTKTNLPYTEAALFESMRISPIVPLGVPHMTTCDTSIGEYTIPKGTQTMLNVWAIHHNPEYFKDPWTYNPDRWLDDNGKFLYHPYHFVSFSMGRRVCVGESLAKAELPLIAALFLQKLKFERTTKEKVEIEGNEIFGILEPKPFLLKAIPRH